MRSFPIFKRLPSPQSLMENRFLKPFASYLHHHSLWQINRRAVAGGVAVGLFFGLLVPFAQILLAAIAAVIFRVNLPVAAASTLVTNPFTFAPIYYFAYKLGNFLTGWFAAEPSELAVALNTADLAAKQTEVTGWFPNLLEWAGTVGLPLTVGLVVLAVTCASAGYFIVSGLWRLHAARRWNKRRLAKPADQF